MPKGERGRWLLGYAAAFAALAGFVFWGTWSPDFAPVMPDCVTTHASDWFVRWWKAWAADGKFVPGDLRVFLGSPYYWQELNYVVPMGLSGIGLAYLLRGRGLSYFAAFGAGLLLAFCGYWCTLFSAGHLGWFRWMAYGVFGFGLVDRAVRTNRLRFWLLLGACVAWGSFYQPDLWLLFTGFTGVFFLWRCLCARTFPWRGALLAGGVFLVIGAPAIRFAFVNDLAGRDRQIAEGQTVAPPAAGEPADAAERRWVFVTNWSLPPAETAEFVVPRLNGDTSCPFTLALAARSGRDIRPYTGALGRPLGEPTGNYRQHSLYVGWVTCLLAGIAVLAAMAGWARGGSGGPARAVRREVGFFLAAAVVFWLFSLGRNCAGVYRLVYALPFGDYLRAPVKWHHLTEFCLCVLAGYGIETLTALLSRVLPLKSAAVPVVGAIVLFGACDLARVDRLYCAPMDLREPRRRDCQQQLTILRRSDFSHPQVASLVQAKQIVPLARMNAELYLVGVLKPHGRSTKPFPPFGAAAWLGILSMTASLGVVAFALKRERA